MFPEAVIRGCISIVLKRLAVRTGYALVTLRQVHFDAEDKISILISKSFMTKRTTQKSKQCRTEFCKPSRPTSGPSALLRFIITKYSRSITY